MEASLRSWPREVISFQVSSGLVGGRVDRLQPGDPSEIGPFRLLGRLGEGGMGRVFLGASAGGRKVAIKIVHPQYANDTEFRRRFAREVAAARQVGGFHTALVVDADPGADPPWMATAYIAGPSLADAVAQRGPLDEAGVRELGAVLSEGLAAIHACGIIHRDLKPGNVILADDGPRIIDFGIAKGADATGLTASHVVIGSLRYMSPEQLNGRELTPQSDVFALGTILAYAATGHDPFRSLTVPAVINRILNDPPDLDPLAGDLRGIIADCLAKEPGSRPSLSDLIARFTHPESHDPTVISALGPVPAAVLIPEPSAVGPNEPERPAAPEPYQTSTISAAIVDRRTASARDAAPARKPQPRRHKRRAGLIAAGASVVIALAAIAAFILDKHPANTVSTTITHSGNSPSATRSLASTLSDPTSSGASSVAFSAKGSTLAVGDQNGNTYLWSLATGKIIATLTNPSGEVVGVNSLAFSPHGTTLATGDGYGGTYLWSVTAATGTITASLTDPRSNSDVSSVAFSPDGATLAVGDYDGSTYLWNVTTGTVTATLTAPGRNSGVSSVAFSPNGTTLAVGRQDGTTYLWSLPARKITATLTTPGSRGAESVAFSPDGTILATGDFDGSTYLWNLASRRITAILTTSGSRGAESVAFSPDGTILAIGDADGSTYLWKIANHKF